MLRRRQLHKIFDIIKCDTWRDIVERNGFASEKNFILKDCYLTLQQLSELENGLLMKKVKCLEKVLLNHVLSDQRNSKAGPAPESLTMSVPLEPCKACKLNKLRCEVCQGQNGAPFYEYEISVGSTCVRCGMKAHNECLKKRHKCSIIRDGADGIELLY